MRVCVYEGRVRECARTLGHSFFSAHPRTHGRTHVLPHLALLHHVLLNVLIPVRFRLRRGVEHVLEEKCVGGRARDLGFAARLQVSWYHS